MKKLTLALTVTIFAMAPAAYGQAKAGTGSGQPSDLIAASAAGSTRSRVLGSEVKSLTSANHSVDKSAKTEAPSKLTRPRAGAVSTNATVTASTSLHQIYRIGVGDVLDVRLANMPTSKSTLFTVIEGGLLDYPLSNAPITVSGLTTEEVAEQLQARIKVLDNPRVSVKVRDYASHSVIVTGAVLDPGARFLRREVTPLYVLLAEAQPRLEAVKATITRIGVPAINLELTSQADLATLVLPGDVIKVLAKPTEPATYFYAGGAVNAPGQKIFHNGLTLTQAIMASGGLTRAAGTKVKVSRQANDGRLAVTEYNLRQIEEGKTPDPVLQEGDRVAVSEGR
jgi:protein involved in polysaccharide export with SLBB domain